MHMKKGNEHYRATKYEEAIAEYNKVLRIDPTNWDASYLVAVSYLALYHPGSTHAKDLEYADRAIAAFERCLELSPPNSDAMDKVRNYYLSLLVAADRRDKATAYLENQLRKEPQNTDLMVQLAGTYSQGGNFPKALEYYEMRAAAEPQNKEAWYTIGVACWDRSYHAGPSLPIEEREAVIEKGIAALNKALELDPNYADALSYLNLIYREKASVLSSSGKLQEANDAFLKAEELRKKALELSQKKG